MKMDGPDRCPGCNSFNGVHARDCDYVRWLGLGRGESFEGDVPGQESPAQTTLSERAMFTQPEEPQCSAEKGLQRERTVTLVNGLGTGSSTSRSMDFS